MLIMYFYEVVLGCFVWGLGLGTVWVGVDESGNIGFDFRKRGTTRFLVISYVFVVDVFSVKKRMRRVWRELVRKRLWPKEVHELKFTFSKAKALSKGIRKTVAEKVSSNIQVVRKRVLKEISGLGELGLVSAVSVVDKRSASDKLRHTPGKLYNYVFAHPFVTRFLQKYNPPPGSSITVLLDKRVGARAEESLRKYVERKYDYMRNQELRIDYNVRLDLKQVNSEEEPLIWVADFIAGSVYVLFEHGDRTYINVVRDLLFDCAYFWAGPTKCYEYLGI